MSTAVWFRWTNRPGVWFSPKNGFVFRDSHQGKKSLQTREPEWSEMAFPGLSLGCLGQWTAELVFCRSRCLEVKLKFGLNLIKGWKHFKMFSYIYFISFNDYLIVWGCTLYQWHFNVQITSTVFTAWLVSYQISEVLPRKLFHLVITCMCCNLHITETL